MPEILASTNLLNHGTAWSELLMQYEKKKKKTKRGTAAGQIVEARVQAVSSYWTFIFIPWLLFLLIDGSAVLGYM